MNIDRETLRVAPSLTLAVTYNREIRAGIERIWENVFDWEHLPVFARNTFPRGRAARHRQLGLACRADQATGQAGPANGSRTAGRPRQRRLSQFRWRLPLLVEFDGEEFRILATEDGTLLVDATTCPHWLGPLAEVEPENDILRCPWHGYRFDVRTGDSADGRGYRPAPAPLVAVDALTDDVMLLPTPETDRPRSGSSTVNSPISGRKEQT